MNTAGRVAILMPHDVVQTDDMYRVQNFFFKIFMNFVKVCVVSTANVQPPSTPSARISALGIVGNCLRKIGALELKGRSREKRRASQISKSVSDHQEAQVKTTTE